MKAMILAAGLGTRLKPWTDHHPKALAVVNGKSLLQRNIEYLKQFGINEVVVNVHHFANQIINAININKGWGSKIIISDETKEVLETGGGLLKGAWFFKEKEPFVLINVDILTNLDILGMVNYHKQNIPLATLATTNRVTSRYFLFDENNNLCGWRNIKTGEEKTGAKPLGGNEQQKAFSGVHIINPQIFSLIKQKGKFSMVEVYLSLMDQHLIKSFDHSNTVFIDVGKLESISKAEKVFI
ncbi:MAG: NTP transferase domain-containing protein [Segetibacter sp.]|jgi:NDP-sugar pyrophosphorylase family protein|nr:NTP transferase domain-containing protein [Segetibacter sp.]